jgi:hypothetical protein
MRAYYKESLENAIYYISKEFKKITNKDIDISGVCAVLIAFDYEHLCDVGTPAIDVLNDLDVCSKTHKFKLKVIPKKLKITNNKVSDSERLVVNFDYFSESEIAELTICIEYLIKDNFPFKVENYIMYLFGKIINS